MPTRSGQIHGVRRVVMAISSIASLSSPHAVHAVNPELRQAWWGEAAGDQFSFAVSSIGDVNLDGRVDMLVGANVNDSSAPAGGKAYVHLGTSTGFAVAPIGCSGSVAGEQLGRSVAGGVDLNGDGIDDWLVGAPGIGDAGTLAGRVYVYWGGGLPNGYADLILEGITPAGGFGEAVTVLPDFDGDGFADVAVGAPRDGDGKVFVYRGGPNMDATADATLTAGNEDQRFGAALACLPDQNNDGRSELVIGSPRSSRSATWAGAVLVAFGTPGTNPQADLVLLGEGAGDAFGASLVVGANINADTHPDLLVGAPAANPADRVDAGAAYGFACGPSFDDQPDLVLEGTNAADRFGTSLAAGFDWNEDGFADLAIGAPFEDTQLQDAGVCAVFLGGPLTNDVRDASLGGDAVQQQFASSLAGVGVAGQPGFLLVGDFFLGSGRAQLFGAAGSPTDTVTPAFSASRLQPPWPNPFNPQVRTSLQLTSRGAWRVQVYDSRGRFIALLLDASLDSGTHHLLWNGRTDAGRMVASGVYWIRAQGPSHAHTARITLVR